MTQKKCKMYSMKTHQVLLLNASYEPLSFCNWRRAIGLILKGKAEALESLEDMPLNNVYVMPLVIRLQYYVKIPYKTPPLNRKNLMIRDKHTCQYCGKNNIPLSIDHVVPKSKGGQDEWENLVVACRPCNVKKGNRSPEAVGMKLRRLPYRPAHVVHFELTQAHGAKVYQETLQKYLYHLIPNTDLEDDFPMAC